MSPTQVRQLERLFDLPEVLEQIKINATKNFDLTVAYLDQEGVFDQEPVAIVDLGWNGTIHNSICDILKNHLQKPEVETIGFYFGISELLSNESSSAKTVLSFELQKLRKNRFFRAAQFFEILASASHGSTTGYHLSPDGVKVEPQLDSQGNCLVDWQYDELVEGAIDFAKEHVDLLVDSCDSTYWCLYADAYVDYLNGNLVCREFAECIGSYPFSCDSDENGLRQLGPYLSIFDAVRYFFASPQRSTEITLWPNGSAVRSSWLVKLVMCKLPTRYLKYFVRPWLCYELLPYSVAIYLVKITPKPIVRFLQKRIFGVKIH